jgi:hypothetical protein
MTSINKWRNDMSDLQKLMSLCKCGVFVSVNLHRDYYQTVEEYFDELKCCGDQRLDDDVKAKMIKTDTVIHIQFYPDTPGGSHNIYHHDLEKAFEESFECFG